MTGGEHEMTVRTKHRIGAREALESRATRRAVIVAYFAFLALGCGADDQPSSPRVDGGTDGVLSLAPDAGPSSDGAPVAADGASPTAGALYAVSTQVIGPMSSTTYVALVPSLDTTEKIDLTKALELPGRALAVGPDRGGAMFVSGTENPTLTRYDVTPDGRFVKGASASFAGVGLTSLFAYAEQFVFVSATKAYFFDDDTLQAVIWNPSTMTVTGTVSLAALNKPGWSVTFGIATLKRGNEVVLTTGYYDQKSQKNLRGVNVVFVDTATDQVTIASDDRCAYVASGSVLAPTGDIYIASDVWTSAIEEVLGAESGGPACILRIKAGERRVDPTFMVKHNERTGGAPAGSLLAGPGNTVFVRVLDRALLPSAKPKTVQELWGGAYWRWWALDLTGPGAMRVAAELPPGPASILQYQVDGRTLTNESSADYAMTTLLDLGAAGGAKRGVSMNGVPFAVVRVR
jgi:hypothetical protein